MLPKRLRLPVQDKAQVHSTTKHTPFFTLKTYIAGGNKPRFGVVVSKKVAESAVVRNKIKRRVFTACAKAIARIPVLDYIFLMRAKSVNANTQELYESIISVTIH